MKSKMIDAINIEFPEIIMSMSMSMSIIAEEFHVILKEYYVIRKGLQVTPLSLINSLIHSGTHPL